MSVGPLVASALSSSRSCRERLSAPSQCCVWGKGSDSRKWRSGIRRIRPGARPKDLVDAELKAEAPARRESGRTWCGSSGALARGKREAGPLPQQKGGGRPLAVTKSRETLQRTCGLQCGAPRRAVKGISSAPNAIRAECPPWARSPNSSESAPHLLTCGRSGGRKRGPLLPRGAACPSRGCMQNAHVSARQC